MNRWGKIPPNKIAVEQMDSAAAFEQQEQDEHCEKKYAQVVKNPLKVVAPRFSIHLRPWAEKYVDQITR